MTGNVPGDYRKTIADSSGGAAADGPFTLDQDAGAALGLIGAADPSPAPVPGAVMVRAGDPTLDGGKTEIAFIDSSVPDYQTLVDDVRPGVEVVTLSGSEELQQIAAYLNGRSDIAAIHIISHGDAGVLALGSEDVTNATIAADQSTLASIGDSLAPGGDLLLYGCDIAAGSAGQSLVSQIAGYTKANVAASVDPTGAASLGGNWDLEFDVGSIDVATAINAVSGANYNALLTTYAFTDGTASATGFNASTVQTTYQDLTIKETDNEPDYQHPYDEDLPSIYFSNTYGVQGTGNYAFWTEQLDFTKTNHTDYNVYSLDVFGGNGSTYLGQYSAPENGADGYNIDIYGYNGSGVQTGSTSVHITASATAPVLVNLTDVSGFLDIADLRVTAEGNVDVANMTTTPACFAAGTRIATARGEVAVQVLREGDAVVLATGGQARVKWLGHRRTACARHPRPWDVMPVHVRPHAFGPGQPHADLWLSPDHAVVAAGHLIPIRYLVNGATVVQEAVDTITYWHVELPAHGVLLAEGLPAESYLDTGNRSAFANGGDTPMLHPDFARKLWNAAACAPLATDGAVVAAVRLRLATQAEALGWRITVEPELSLEIDGQSCRLHRLRDTLVAVLPPGARRAMLRSDIWAPAEHGCNADARCLGVAVAALTLDGVSLALDDARLLSGWHPPEAGWRWTDGDAEIALDGAARLTLRLGGPTSRYWLPPNKGEKFFGSFFQERTSLPF